MSSTPQYFFILGAAKSGTTALHAALAGHPQIAAHRRKESGFFAGHGSTDWAGPATQSLLRAPESLEEYEQGFPISERPGPTWRLDASTDYLWSETACDRIGALAQTHRVKALCILRNPVDRVVSEYRHTLRLGMQTCDILTSLDREPSRIAKQWHPLFYHRRRSDYPDQVARYRAALGDDLMILDYDDLRTSDVAGHVLKFLDLADTDAPDLERKNESRSMNRADRLMRAAPTLRSLGRLLPKSVRRGIYRASERPVPMPTRAEIEEVGQRLDDIVARCEQSSLIDTGTWQLKASRATRA